MNGFELPDLLPHRYRPISIDKLPKCHVRQAQALKQWILDFINISSKRQAYDSDTDDSDLSRDSKLDSNRVQIEKKCALLTGPPGVGKTSLVYTIASELKLHVIESHPSEKRDFKLFSTLKLANQKGKINPIAKLFQAAQQKQAEHRETRRKKRKLNDASNLQQQQQQQPTNGNHTLSLSGDSSLLLFDDIDVVFEEDGPFLKSLVEFIRDSKRPVILTATQSIDHIKETIVHLEHIHLQKPIIDDCIQLIRGVCKQENFNRLNRTIDDCRLIADELNCDIRQCLNRIHFYGNDASDSLAFDNLSADNIEPAFDRLNLSSCKSELENIGKKCNQQVEDDETIDYYKDEDTNLSDTKTEILDPKELSCNNDVDVDLNEFVVSNNSLLLDCYNTSSIIDLMSCTFNYIDRRQSLSNWLNGKPSPRGDIYDNNYDLGEQIKSSIVDLSKEIYLNELASVGELKEQRKQIEIISQNWAKVTNRINVKIKGRIEPPDKEFYTEIVPMLGEIVTLEAIRRQTGVQPVLQQQSIFPTTTTTTTTTTPTTTTTNGNSTNNSHHHLSPFASSRRSRRIPSYLESIPLYLEPEEFILVSDTLLTADKL